MSNDFDYTPPPDCGHKEYRTETCASCIYKVYSLELQRVIEERDEALASDAESCAMYRSARDRAEQAEQKLKQTQAELKRTQDYAEGPSWGTHRESLVSVAERQRQACLQGWIDMCWKVARENASVGPDGWLERYHPEDNEVSQMLRSVPLVTGEDK
jgi:hypothetical protein